MNKLLNPNPLGALEENVCAIHIGMGESVRVAKAQIHVGLRGKMENGVDVVPLQAIQDFSGVRDIAVVKGEISLLIQDTGVV